MKACLGLKKVLRLCRTNYVFPAKQTPHEVRVTSLLLEEWKFRWGVTITKSLLCPSSAYNPFLKWTLNLGTLAIGISKRGMGSPAFRWNKILRHTNTCRELFDKQVLAMSWWCFVNLSEAKSTVPARFHNCLIIVPIIKHLLKVSGSHWPLNWLFFSLFNLLYGNVPLEFGQIQPLQIETVQKKSMNWCHKLETGLCAEHRGR